MLVLNTTEQPSQTRTKMLPLDLVNWGTVRLINGPSAKREWHPDGIYGEMGGKEIKALSTVLLSPWQAAIANICCKIVCYLSPRQKCKLYEGDDRVCPVSPVLNAHWQLVGTQ